MENKALYIIYLSFHTVMFTVPLLTLICKISVFSRAWGTDPSYFPLITHGWK